MNSCLSPNRIILKIFGLLQVFKLCKYYLEEINILID